jgi:hypothetical protein
MRPPSAKATADNLRVNRERRLVRKGGFEPPRYCYRQPLKLVRLPVSPLPLGREIARGSPHAGSEDPAYFFGGAGAGAGCAGADWDGPLTPLNTEPGPRCP